MRIKGIIILLYFCIQGWAQDNVEEYSYKHPIPFLPETYVSYYAEHDIKIDGVFADKEWDQVAWTKLFVDIEGENKPNPFLSTRAKITWNDTYLFIAAHMEEPHIWATLTERDAIMFHDDDFEVFIDPDGDGHNYFELEMNAFNSIWDLYMLYPYYMDDRRNYIMNWNIKGLKSAVHIEGSINDPGDQDQYWSIELAIPWEAFEDFKKGNGRPEPGEQWRFNFSRVDWPVEIRKDRYHKKKNDKGKNLPERNWVWSPTGYINMHKPETWGYVQFEKEDKVKFINKKEEEDKWALWQLFYQVKECWKSGNSNCSLDQMDQFKIEKSNLISNLSIDEHGFTVSIENEEGVQYSLNHLGRLTQK